MTEKTTGARRPCRHCADPDDGKCLYPYYGQALLGPNFLPDPDAQGLGTFTHCPQCGACAGDRETEPRNAAQ